MHTALVKLDETLHSLPCLHFSQSPASALYHSLAKVYNPLLSGGDHWTPKMQNLMAELQKGLGSILRRREQSSGDL